MVHHFLWYLPITFLPPQVSHEIHNIVVQSIIVFHCLLFLCHCQVWGLLYKQSWDVNRSKCNHYKGVGVVHSSLKIVAKMPPSKPIAREKWWDALISRIVERSFFCWIGCCTYIPVRLAFWWWSYRRRRLGLLWWDIINHHGICKKWSPSWCLIVIQAGKCWKRKKGILVSHVYYTQEPKKSLERMISSLTCSLKSKKSRHETW